MRRALSRFLDQYPIADALMEIFVVWLFTFLPIVIAATMVQSRIENFIFEGFWIVFYSFFAKGELSLIALGVAGSIVFIASFKPSGRPRFLSGLLVLIVTVCLLYLGAVIGDNPGFREILPYWILRNIFIVFAIFNLFWFIFLATSKNISVSKNPQDETVQADDVISQSRAFREE